MLDVEQRSGVAVVRLRHGKVNALDLELLRALTGAMGDVDESAAMVLTGTGTVFSAGVDLQRIVAGGPSYVQQFLPALSAAFMAIFDRPGPVLAAINGHAIAGGCVIAAACDVRVMSQGKILDSVFRQAQTMAQIPADVFAFSKRQLQRPARERIAARSGDEEAVLAMWSSARTRDAITGYLSQLTQRPR